MPSLTCNSKQHAEKKQLIDPKIEPRISGKFVYFYQMRGYYNPKDKKWLYTTDKSLGKISLSVYKNHKSEINKMKVDKLKEFIKSFENE